MTKKKFTTAFCLALIFCSELSAQFYTEIGINYLNSHNITIGVGAYLEPRYALNKNEDLGLHLGLNAFVGDDQSRTQSRRTTSGTIPVVLGTYIRRFPKNDATAIPYLGFGAGIYLKGEEQFIEDIKAGAILRFGVFVRRSNFGFTQNFVLNDSFFQFSYGFRILARNR